jgi:hypothetical protein
LPLIPHQHAGSREATVYFSASSKRHCVIAARQGDLEQAIHQGTQALSAPRKSLPSLLMVSRDLTKVLNDHYPNEPETQAYLDQLHALNSLTHPWSGV